MIKSIEIKGLRGILEGKLDDLAPLTILVGPNGCGKSTILDALLIGASPFPGEAIGQSVLRRCGLNEGAQWLFWRNGNVGTTVKVTTDEDAYHLCELSLEVTAASQEPTRILCSVTNGRTGDFAVTFQNGNRYTHNKDHHPLNGVADIAVVEFSSTVLQSPLHQLHTRSIQQGHRKEVKEILSSVVPGLSDITILTEGDDPLVYLEFEDRAIPVALR